jgi:chitin synthase
MFSNQTACHLSSTARSEYASFQTQGVPNKKGGYDKAGRVYYDWDDITPESPLIVYNGYRSSYRILNLILTL